MIYLNVRNSFDLMRSLLLVISALLVSPLCAQEQASTPLPDPAELIRRLDANQKNVERLRRNYICLVQQEITHLDKEGNAKKVERREYEEWYVAGEPIRRTISRDGVPFDADEKRKEEERVAKREKEARERQAKRDRGEHDKDDLTIRDFLRSSRFTNLRREVQGGRNLLAMDFEPNPEFKPHGRAEDFASRLEGSVWVDEYDLQIARLEARFKKGMRVAGFLASVREGSHAVFEQARVNDEVWMPTFVDANIDARVLFKGVNQRFVNRFSNYRKFTTTSTIRGVVDDAPQQPK
jgi:hypothetical protein